MNDIFRVVGAIIPPSDIRFPFPSNKHPFPSYPRAIRSVEKQGKCENVIKIIACRKDCILFIDPPILCDPLRKRQFKHLTRCRICKSPKINPETDKPFKVSNRTCDVYNIYMACDMNDGM